ncbi:unnamed protein product [Closterium sp. NIES-53]
MLGRAEVDEVSGALVQRSQGSCEIRRFCSSSSSPGVRLRRFRGTGANNKLRSGAVTCESLCTFLLRSYALPARERSACPQAQLRPCPRAPLRPCPLALPASSLRPACALPARTPPALTRTLPAPCPPALMCAAATVTYAAATAACAAAVTYTAATAACTAAAAKRAAATACAAAAAKHCCYCCCYMRYSSCALPCRAPTRQR